MKADVQPGQTWIDNDKRSKGRRIRIVSVDARYAYGCTIREDDTVIRETRIALERFKPNSTGYRLEQR